MTVGYSVGNSVDGNGPFVFSAIGLEVVDDNVHVVDIKSPEGNILLVGGFAVHASDDDVDGVFRLVGVC